MNKISKIILIFVVITITVVCGILVLNNSEEKYQTPINMKPEMKQLEIKTIKPGSSKPTVPDKPFTQDENGVPKSDFKVPEIG